MYPTSRPFLPPQVEAAPKPTMKSANGALAVERPRETIPTNGNPDEPAVHIVAQQTDALRWLLRLTVGLLVVLVLAGAVGFWMMNRALRDGRTATPTEPAVPLAAVAPVASQPPAALPPPQTVAQPNAGDDAKKPKSPPRRGQAMPITAAPGLETAERERFLQVIGNLTGAQLYQSYLNIGFLADGVNAQTYQKEDTLKLLEAVNTALANMDRQMVNLAQASITAEDKKQLARIQQAIALLQTQSHELQSLCQTPDPAPLKPEQLASYQKARREAWRNLAELLSLE